MGRFKDLGRLTAFIVATTLGLGSAAAREITINDRVQAQKAIETVYWRHRIWPNENTSPKPDMTAVMPDNVIRTKVQDYLLKSSALDTLWHRPIDARQLQAELDRMARDTRDGATLRELFEALGSDPALIAETLAREALATRLVHDFYAMDDRFQGEIRKKAEAARTSCRSYDCLKACAPGYQETTWTLAQGGADRPDADNSRQTVRLDAEDWTAKAERLQNQFGHVSKMLPLGTLSTLEETPDGFVVTSVLAQSASEITTATGIWEKVPFDDWWRTRREGMTTLSSSGAGVFTLPTVVVHGCTPDTWSPSAIPIARESHTAVWTGSEMIVWGGFLNGFPVHDSGRRYDPATDSWATVSSGTGVPHDRALHSAVWTGTEMIVWGGKAYDQDGTPQYCLNTGGRYNPSTDSWIATSSAASVPSARCRHSAAWTGTTMLVWGGTPTPSDLTFLNSGGVYDPSKDAWTPTSIGANTPPSPRYPAVAWTGTDLIIWGGNLPSGYLNTGGRYNPANDSWTATATGPNVPAARQEATAVWTGNEFIVWGGYNNGSLNTGGRLNPLTGTWTATSLGTDVPTVRRGHSALWTGSEMIIWGGVGSPASSTGGRYRPITNSWLPIPSGAGSPVGRSRHTAVWTGSEMIVWGGLTSSFDNSLGNTGGRYSPTTATWIPTSVGGTPPTGRDEHSAVWTGAEMIIWGGRINSGFMNTGGRYNPATDTWSPTSTGTNVPSVRLVHTAVWTGSEMIIWGGIGPGSSYPANGGRYNPASDSWAATSLVGAPQPRGHHEAVWTGSELIVWGGFNANHSTNTGGRYNPSTDTWRATSTSEEVPAPRYYATSVWTGTEMIVWGGLGLQQGEVLQTGGRYDPSGDGWKATPVTTDTPTGRYAHTAVWTGKEMIIWGGNLAESNGLATGSRFDPDTDKWTPMATAPFAADYHAAVWSGREMIEWGGDSPVQPWNNNGSRYDPALDQWKPTSWSVGVPAGRREHTAIWTGTEMLVWGGNQNSQIYLDTLGSYCVASCAVPNVYFQDGDGDAHGITSIWIQACDMPAGYSSIAGDCADADANTYAGAPEIMDGIDNQCAGDDGFGVIDEISGPTWWNGSTYRWTAQALATEYQLLRSGTASFSSDCLIRTSNAPSFDENLDPASGETFFYLVRSSAPVSPGSWGQRSDGSERWPSCLQRTTESMLRKHRVFWELK